AIPVSADEFAARGITFDRDRLVQPFITDEVLGEVFGGLATTVGAELQGVLDTIRSRFLQPAQSGRYALKPEYVSQPQLETLLRAQEDNALNRCLRDGIYDLISNVILLEANRAKGSAAHSSGHFHFRFGMESTSSFKYLNFQTKSQLKALYIDYFFHDRKT